MAWLLLERELQCRVSPLQETLALSSGTVARQACASVETPNAGGSALSSGSDHCVYSILFTTNLFAL